MRRYMLTEQQRCTYTVTGLILTYLNLGYKLRYPVRILVTLSKSVSIYGHLKKQTTMPKTEIALRAKYTSP